MPAWQAPPAASGPRIAAPATQGHHRPEFGKECSMGNRIAIIGAGAVGGYAGAHMVQAGEDVTFVDMWPEHVEAMRRDGLRITHIRDVPEFTVPVQALHLTELQQVSKQRPFDIAFICVKSYDTAWATTMVKQYLAPGGFCVSLQNCMNEETIAGIVGWGRTLGAIASSITVELCEPGHVRRASGKGGAAHTVFRVGEVHGRITDRAQEVGRLCALSDSCVVTANLWGERWSKLVTNAMANGLSACTGLISREILLDDTLRQFTARLGSEAIRVGQALGYSLEEVHHLDPEIIARAGEGDAEARRAYDEHRIREANKPGGGAHRPSMGQDMVKGRRTEIEFLNGFITDRAQEIGLATPANAALTEIVKRVEKGELQPDPQHIKALRLN
ncbi:2-dehydropantoate 2-reductase [Roseicella frigidaeris]|uniref:2-dehydropantoate 2-reductase n=2 Tax=Roseicella frigidaeris TaxID=2230885 RepID=A0A327MLM1_9PROT|nr:2-dehydropantoate 2-reductase [Roseicella frigidaeris]